MLIIQCLSPLFSMSYGSSLFASRPRWSEIKNVTLSLGWCLRNCSHLDSWECSVSFHLAFWVHSLQKAGCQSTHTTLFSCNSLQFPSKSHLNWLPCFGLEMKLKAKDSNHILRLWPHQIRKRCSMIKRKWALNCETHCHPHWDSLALQCNCYVPEAYRLYPLYC